MSFGYWCTNFLVVQRAMAARDMTAARRTPLIAAIPKMLMPALVILPGMLAIALATLPGKNYRLPPRPIINQTEVVAAFHAATPQNIAGITKAVGFKMDPAQVTALVTENAARKLTDDQIAARLQAAVLENDYDGVILSLVKKYCPTGLLGLALTALLASFMSGMAGNVTAFNTVWTYDLYQAYMVKNRSDAHYMWMGRFITVVGVLLSIACAYFASNYSNAMDIIQLVFGFVNAPLFATFLLGMFWARCTGTGAFLGLLLGTLTSAAFHALTLGVGNVPGIKGGYVAVLKWFPSDMAQNFWLAIFAFVACFVLTAVISLLTKRTKTDAELTGLVYSLTPRVADGAQAWITRPAVFGTILLIGCVILNILFW
jgi:SSS family solute:Na+ symporter